MSYFFYGLAEFGFIAIFFFNLLNVVLTSDLEGKHITALDFCEKVNVLVLPEILGQAALTAILVITGNFKLVILNIVMMSFHIQKVLTSRHLIGAGGIVVGLPAFKQEALAKCGFYLFNCVACLYLMVVATRE